MANCWIIQRKSDKFVLPFAKSHCSYLEVCNDLPPRLFTSKGTAKSVLTTWCKGYQYLSRVGYGEDSYDEGPLFMNKGMRNIEEYEIKEVAIIYV